MSTMILTCLRRLPRCAPALLTLLAFNATVPKACAQAPTIAAISPDHIWSNDAQFSLDIFGTGFVNGCQVLWNGAPVSFEGTTFETSFLSSTHISVDPLPTGVAGPVRITVMNPDGSVSNAKVFTQVPDALPPIITDWFFNGGDGGNILSVTGQNFSSGIAYLLINGTAVAPEDYTQVTLTSAQIAGSQPLVITVQARGTSNAVNLYLNNNPYVTEADYLASQNLLIVNGENLNPGAVINFNGTPLATNWVSETELTAATSASQLPPAGATVLVTVTNSFPASETSDPVHFVMQYSNYLPSAAFSVDDFDGYDMINDYQAFGDTPDPPTDITWNGLPFTLAWGSASEVGGIIPTDLTCQSGTVVVNMPSLGATYAFYNPGVKNLIASLSPASDTAGDAGLLMVVNGVYFRSDSVVQWNGSDLPTTFVSTGQLLAEVPASDLARAQTATVTVFDPYQGVTAGLPFSVLSAAPVMTALSPSSTFAGSPAITLTITGSGFAPSTTAQWNGANLPTTYYSATLLKATVPASYLAVAGTATVAVSASGGTPASLPFTARPLKGVGAPTPTPKPSAPVTRP